ncbi:uncharacterized protein BO80DRAFT_457300 [Aspergillus ibericus CBS 121593]|uniref:Mid2 domain-containing protein n=1 Tax=Aspergillus ibericus CBS 121593 TaxID=1448316 RepID=A0A395GSB2_9EURO|nr:hypothetical protein BO80DRAFT_457300 [Aspergillus ibericus CBS 121593]RAK98471.1 hypothetical protein BO80DRAFT_457300 [Aspergillus ibericus CBS 121593]
MSSTCHGMHNSEIEYIKADLACGVTNSTHPYVNCCVNGDYCLSNSICVNTRSKKGDYYYAADCTDETLEDAACGTRCGGRNNAEIVYTSEGYWACCENDSGTVNCSNPSKEIWAAPAPSQLATIQYLPPTASGTPTYAVATSTSTSSSTTTSSTSTSSATASSSSGGSSGISAGAAAGIGVGAAAGFVLVAVMLALLYFRRRTASNVLPQGAAGYNGLDETWSQKQPAQAEPIYELDRSAQHAELDGLPRS